MKFTVQQMRAALDVEKDQALSAPEVQLREFHARLGLSWDGEEPIGAEAKPLESLAEHLKGRDVRAIVRGALDGYTYWVLFGPGDHGCYCVDNYVYRKDTWEPNGDSIEAGDKEGDGWDMLGALFVRSFTAA